MLEFIMYRAMENVSEVVRAAHGVSLNEFM